MKTLTQFIVKYLAPFLYKFAYENKDDFIRYARNALNARLPVVWAVIQKKLGLSPNLAKLIENTAVQILDENALEEVPLAGSEDILPIETDIIYTIDQSKRVYTIYACVPTSTYLRWCASVGQVPSDAEYLKFLNTLEDEGLWNPLSGATSLFVALRAVKYFNELYPDKQVQLVHAKDMDATTYDMLYAGYQGVVTRKVSTGYSADRIDNKRIDSEIYANASWGHCEGVIIGKNLKPENVRVVDSNGVRDYTYDNDLVSWNADNVIMLDNYPDKGKYNNFYINDKIAGLMNSGFFSRSVFFFKPLFLEAEKQEESDYEKGLKELGIVENPNPDRMITERLLITLLYRYAKGNDSKE